MAFILTRESLKILCNKNQSEDFLNYLVKRAFQKNNYKSFGFNMKIKKIGRQGYIGNCFQTSEFIYDLIFTPGLLKEMHPVISAAFAHTLLSMAEGNLTPGKCHRQQGAMHSVLVPGTNQQSVIEYSYITKKKQGRQALLLDSIGKGCNWHSNNNLSRINNFDKLARTHQAKFTPIYHAGLSYINA